ncbi:uncharacterized protein LOC128861310 [Anastrepha ludens]|uniref:uncharacterized protein LOC128861310 n=1 Tax=Anastrepha ludens TaxID=28586 RepID=UPI0023B0080B|nr:uncharacterized protein LOC128861310 [Anastrepha ludens]
MRTVHESAFKPKLSAETKFIVDIRPANHNAAALNSVNAVANNNMNSNPLEVNATNGGGHNGLVVDAAVGAHRRLSGNGGVSGSSRNSKAEVNWHRVFTVSSLFVSLLLISGSIYLHLRQKHHLGRLHHDQHSPAAGSVATTPTTIDAHSSASVPASSGAPSAAAATSGNSFTTSSVTAAKASQPRWNALPDMDSRSRHITEACMQCICETTTECRPATCGNNVDCGVFRISRPYWLDAGKPALEGDEHNNSNTTKTYYHCVNNIYCATRAVAAYISKYARDCNGDGIIECRDHIALHLLGPRGCAQSEWNLSPVFVRRMEDCLAELK